MILKFKNMGKKDAAIREFSGEQNGALSPKRGKKSVVLQRNCRLCGI